MNPQYPLAGVLVIFNNHQHSLFPDELLDDGCDDLLHLHAFLLAVQHAVLEINPQQVAYQRILVDLDFLLHVPLYFLLALKQLQGVPQDLLVQLMGYRNLLRFLLVSFRHQLLLLHYLI